ncbi:hypothetical protein [Streptomyces sp. 2A115]|uniref:hypothetical protein n=1 Tax=Streptomyces sp. 2A115 TaxID=3457439 RepID=UPI003FD6A6DA
MDYPHIAILARDAGENPIDIKLQINSSSGTISDTDILNALKDFLTDAPGVNIVAANLFSVRETPV